MSPLELIGELGRSFAEDGEVPQQSVANVTVILDVDDCPTLNQHLRLLSGIDHLAEQ